MAAVRMSTKEEAAAQLMEEGPFGGNASVIIKKMMELDENCCQCATSALKKDGGPSDRKRARMADGPANVSQLTDFDLGDFLQSGGQKVPDYLTWVSDLVFAHKGKKSILKNPAGATLTIADLDGTIYRGKDKVMNGWGNFYLPEEVSMQVVGVVEGTSCPCDQLVLMTCEDRQLYAYDGDELHVVASSLKQLCEEGIEYPASKSYYKGEAFKDMTEKEWENVRNSAVGKRLDEEHHKLVMRIKSRFLENLRSTRHFMEKDLQLTTPTEQRKETKQQSYLDAGTL